MILFSSSSSDEDGFRHDVMSWNFHVSGIEGFGMSITGSCFPYVSLCFLDVWIHPDTGASFWMDKVKGEGKADR